MGNPDWVRDEIILAMALYFRAGRKQLGPNHPDVIDLSHLLNALPIHAQCRRESNFRNPNGISMILGNFLGIDPEYAQNGLLRNNHLQAEVWMDFADRIPELMRTAEAIEHCVAYGLPKSTDERNSEDDAYVEGRLLVRLHVFRERNSTVVGRKKALVLAACGRLDCEACGFDFERAYGELGRGFAECHHKLALAHGGLARITKMDDLAIVCANCHRMLHRQRCRMTVENLRQHLHGIRN